jgi:FKBP12-rapamycin complex-associated protein
MVGYILGLGDRHPSNLMVDRITGRVIHIDFGDCFEVTAKRRICPEVVPFRLTRMMEIAMEASGIQGTFRLNCERTMSVIRDNHDSVMAMLEAFVYDPLISWRLLANENINMNEGLNNTIYTDTTAQSPKTALGDVDLLNTTLGLGIDLDTGLVTNHGDLRESFGNVKDALTLLSNSLSSGPIAQSIQNSNSMSFHREAVSRRKSIDLSLGDDPPNEENLNARALEVITRIQAKLSGKDFKKFDDDDDLNVEQQVNRLIKEATSIENLCQLYMGWCATW